MGYAMHCSWKKDLSNPNSDTTILYLRQAAIAYIDDTTWIARSEKDMAGILDKAREFYIANDSQVNGAKSVLITINNPEETPAMVKVGPNKDMVIELDRKAFTRFLSVWIGSKNHAKDTVQRVKDEITNVCSILESKWVTDKQAEYVIN
jgi:hypothetical protein